MSEQIKITAIEHQEANNRCICGFCNHQITKVVFSNGAEWFPTNSEYVAVKEMLKLSLLHNLATDKFCFKAQPQKVNIKRIIL